MIVIHLVRLNVTYRENKCNTFFEKNIEIVRKLIRIVYKLRIYFKYTMVLGGISSISG